MGSPIRLTLARSGSGRPETPRRAWATVVASLEASEQAMSRFRETSDLTALNRIAGTHAVRRPPPRLRRALVAADRARRVTDGRFDPRILGDLERLGYHGAPLKTPGDGEGRVARGRPGLSAHDTLLTRHGRDGVSLPIPVDLGGIGKGLGLRWATADLARTGVADFLLEAGGDLIARGRDAGGDPWRIGLEDPTGASAHLAVIDLTDDAVATSSIRVHRWVSDGRTVHHLLDPRTGEPADGGLLSVTVAGPDPAWAEVWSKVLFLGGRRAIAAEARSIGLAAWWVADDGSLEMTADARRRTAWVAAEDEPAHRRPTDEARPRARSVSACLRGHRPS